MADFGLSKTIYEKLYFRQDKSDSVRLPFKWLAIECLEDGLFSEKSDVVSSCIQCMITCIFTASWVTSKGIALSIILCDQIKPSYTSCMFSFCSNIIGFFHG